MAIGLAEAARAYLSADLCVLPAKRTEKRPAVGRWKQYQTRLPGEVELSAWMANSPDAVCILCGQASRNAEILDFDAGGELFDRWCEKVRAAAPGLLERLVLSKTQSDGRHAAYRHEGEVCGNLKLAQRRGDDGKIVTLIETRGEGGLFLCAPTDGYELIHGDLADLPVLTEAERDVLLQAAWELNEYLPPVVDGPTHNGDVGQRGASSVGHGQLSAENSHSGDCPSNNPAVGQRSELSVGQCGSLPENADRPGDDFNRRGDVRAVLEQHGWALARSGQNEYWRRPGKESGWSATLKNRVFFVFSSNAAPFEPNRHYSPFAVYALLTCGGDFEQAARSLGQLGFGGDYPADSAAGAEIFATAQACGAQPPDDSDNAHDGPDIVDPGPFPAHLLEGLPDLVRTAMDYYMTNAIEAQPVMFLASFLAATGAILGHKVKDASGLRTNIYTVGALGTGGGKEATRETVDRMFQRAGLAPMCGAEEFASDAGMIKAVSIQNPILFQIDEFGRLMHSIQLGARHSPHLYNIASALLKLYSKANGTFRSKAYADAKRNMRIDYPHVCVYGTTVLGNFWDALSYEAVKDGFLPRLMIFETPGENVEGGGQETEPPKELVDFFSYWDARRITGGDLERQYPGPMVVPYSPEAAQTMEDFRAEQKREVAAYHELGPLWSRARENAGQVALIHACWKNSEQPIVETDSARWAVGLTRHVVRQTLWRASLSLVDNPFHADCQKALQKLQAEPDGELPHSVLLKRMKMKARDFRDLVQTLEQRGDIQCVQQSTSGQPGLFYRLRSRPRQGVKHPVQG